MLERIKHSDLLQKWIVFHLCHIELEALEVQIGCHVAILKFCCCFFFIEALLTAKEISKQLKQKRSELHYWAILVALSAKNGLYDV